RRLGNAERRAISSLFAGECFDLAVDLRRESDTRDFLHLSGATYTVGYANRGENDWLTVAIPWDGVNAVLPPRRHVALDALRLVEMIALAARADVVTDYRLDSAHDATAEKLLGERLPKQSSFLVG